MTNAWLVMQQLKIERLVKKHKERKYFGVNLPF